MTCAAEWRTTLSASGSFSLTNSSFVSAVSGIVRSTRRGAAAFSAAYIEASLSDWPSEATFWAVSPLPTGVRRATTTAAARRGEMALAMSRGVVPCGTSLMDPSGRWMAMDGLLMAVGASVHGETADVRGDSSGYNRRDPGNSCGRRLLRPTCHKRRRATTLFPCIDVANAVLVMAAMRGCAPKAILVAHKFSRPTRVRPKSDTNPSLRADDSPFGGFS